MPVGILLSSIKPNPNNPRIIKDDKFKKLVQSITDFPEMMAKRPMVCVTDVDGKIFPLGGNMRLKAIQEIGYKEIPEDWITMADEWTEEKRREFIIKDNVGFGEWNWEELANDWDSQQLSDWGLDIPGFDIAPEVTEDDFDGVPPKEPITVLGDLYELNEHRLHCADSTDSDAVAMLMNGKKADMLFTDPPYNVDYEGKTAEKLKIKNDNIKDFQQFLNDAFISADLFMKEGAIYYIAHPDVFAYEFIAAVRNANWKQARPAVVQWVKDQIVMGRGDYHSQTEPILYGWKEGAAHFKVLTRDQSNVWKVDKPKRNGEYPTMKPVALVAKAIQNHSVGLIIDLFFGSGTTLIASDQLNRICYGQELDPKYCDVIVARYIKHRRSTGSSLVIKRNGVELSEDEINKYIENTAA